MSVGKWWDNASETAGEAVDTAGNFLSQFVGGDAVENYTKFVAGSDAPITEQTIDVDMLEALKGAASHSLGKGKNTLSYNDYKEGAGRDLFRGGNSVMDSINKISNPASNAMLTLGEAQLKQHNGELYATDVYDFNNARKDWDSVKKGIDKGVDPIVLGMEYLGSKIRPYTSDNSGVPTMIKLGKLADFGVDGNNIGSAMDYYNDAVNKGLIPNNPLEAIAETPKQAPGGFLGQTAESLVAQNPAPTPEPQMAPQPVVEPKPKPKPKPNSVNVKAGQSLSGIARRLGTDVETLARMNNIRDINKIYAGQTLKY